MLLTFSEYLLTNQKITTDNINQDGSLKDSSLTQSQFSTLYTSWLRDVFSSATVHEWIEGNSTTGFTYDVNNFSVNINQNSTLLLPTITNAAGQTIDQAVLNALFGIKDSMNLVTGKTVQERIYVFNYEDVALREMFAPKVSGPVTGEATEDGATQVLDALANVTDADTLPSTLSVILPETLPSGVTFDPAAKTFSLDPSHAAYQDLAMGATRTVEIEYEVFDGTFKTKATASWTVTGTNDAPKVSAAVSGSASEDGAPSILDALANATDVDSDTTLVVVDLPATLPDGVTWDEATQSFTLDPTNAAYQSLAAGATTKVEVTYAVSDGITTAPASVSWTVTGVNDLAAISGSGSGSVHEDAANDQKSSVEGTLTVSDVDTGEDKFREVSSSDLIKEYGTFTFDADSGKWTFTIDNTAAQSLGASSVVQQTLTITSKDGTASKTITVDVVGANDLATIAGSKTGAVQEDASGETGSLTATGTLAVSDADAGEDVFTAVDPGQLDTQYGSFTFDANTGAWEFTIDNVAAQSLAGGQTIQQTLTVWSKDGTGSETITVDVVGENDGASISGTDAGSVAEDGTQTADGTLSVEDADAGEDVFLAVSADDLKKNYGTFTFEESTGAWSFTIDNTAAQALTGNDTVQQTLTVWSKDGTASKTITVDVVGTNDIATIGGTKTGTVHEDASGQGEAFTVSGQLTASDADAGESAFRAVEASQLTTQYGTFTFNAGTGAWTFALDNAAAQSLTAGQTVQQTLTVWSKDGSTSETITVDVVGKDEAAPPPLVKAAPAVFSGTGDYYDDIANLPASTTQNATQNDDVLYGTPLGDNGLNGLGGDDKVFGRAGNDQINGNNQNDKLLGGSGNDVVAGGNGNDIIIGGFGADTLRGDGGADTFVFRDFRDTGDTIQDFSLADGDKIAFTSNLNVSFDDIDITYEGGNTIISVDKGGSATTYDMQITLSGEHTLTAANFNFGYLIVV